MDMPKPGDAHKRLSAFLGEWSGTETMHPSPWDPKGGTAAARIVNRSIVDGFAIVQEYEQRRGGKVNFRGHGVIWYDAAKQQYVMHWVDSMGGTNNEYRGGFDGDTLTLSAPMPQGGHARSVWAFKPGSYTFALEISHDGQQWAPSMSGSYRKGAAKKTAAKPAKKAAAKKKALKRVGKPAAKSSKKKR